MYMMQRWCGINSDLPWSGTNPDSEMGHYPGRNSIGLVDVVLGLDFRICPPTAEHEYRFLARKAQIDAFPFQII